MVTATDTAEPDPRPQKQHAADTEYAPTFAECLTDEGVRSAAIFRCERALVEWLLSWRGCTPTGASGDEVVEYLARMAGWHR